MPAKLKKYEQVRIDRVSAKTYHVEYKTDYWNSFAVVESYEGALAVKKLIEKKKNGRRKKDCLF